MSQTTEEVAAVASLHSEWAEEDQNGRVLTGNNEYVDVAGSCGG